MLASKYECLSVSGSCRGLMGLGNGAAHTSQATCENAHDCGVYRATCLFNRTNTWNIDGSCSDGISTNQETCLGFGTCADATGVSGNGSNYLNNKNACEGALDCGSSMNSKCFWSPNNTWIDTSYCHGPQSTTIMSEQECLSIGTCADAFGNVDSGAYENKSQACSNANNCGLFNESPMDSYQWMERAA